MARAVKPIYVQIELADSPSPHSQLSLFPRKVCPGRGEYPRIGLPGSKRRRHRQQASGGQQNAHDAQNADQRQAITCDHVNYPLLPEAAAQVERASEFGRLEPVHLIRHPRVYPCF